MFMRKPKDCTVHWIAGINVLDKEIVDVPEHFVKVFEKYGFKRIGKVTGKPKKKLPNLAGDKDGGKLDTEP
jgi:hypothetical protein